jgi:hypothetical protein
MAALATFRLTEILVSERISQPLRQRFPSYLWTCPRCVSVWMGIVATCALTFHPLLNWPFALSFLFNLQAGLMQRLGIRRRHISIDVPPQKPPEMTHTDLCSDDVMQALLATAASVPASLRTLILSSNGGIVRVWRSDFAAEELAGLTRQLNQRR